MKVHDFIELATDLADVYVKIFDYSNDAVVFDERDCLDSNSRSLINDIDFQGYGEYRVVTYDIYKTSEDNIVFQLYIDMDE